MLTGFSGLHKGEEKEEGGKKDGGRMGERRERKKK